MQYILDSVRSIGAKRLATVGAILLIGAIVLVGLNFATTYVAARSYTNELADAFGLSPHLTRALIIGTFIVLSYLGVLVTSLNTMRRRAGILGIAGLLCLHSIGLWAATRDHAFDRKGTANKCFIVTREAILYGDRPGIDPKTGLDCRPVTAEIVERLQKYQSGQRPKRIASANYEFFSSVTGNAVSWYQRDQKGRLELFDLMGFHPETGLPLRAVTTEVVEQWKLQLLRRTPNRIQIDVGQQFFDSLTGEPLVWFKDVTGGKYEFYDSGGFDSSTGQELKPITRENVAKFLEHLKEQDLRNRCYVLLPNSVKYSWNPGIDRDTGKPCRPFTDQQLPFLREYEKGKRPTLVLDKNPTLYDPRSGDAIVWYWRDSQDGRIEIYSLMGFHPRTGEELLPMTKEVADHFYKQEPKKLPQKVDPENFSCFSPTTGESRCWYWTDNKGAHEFYDAPGYHPRKGDQLQRITKQLLEKLEEEALRKKQQLEEEEQKAKKEREAREARAQKEKDEDEKLRTDRRRRLTQLAQECDALAANPNDRNRLGPGVTLDQLKPVARKAATACAEAAKENPGELRLQYQFARAVSFIDKARSLQVLQVLASKQYPAAFDNLGDALLETNDIPGAVRSYRQGAELGDPDAMASLANMINENRAAPRNEAETVESLYHRACSLGHQYSCNRIKGLADKERQRQMDEQGLRIFLGVLKGMSR